MATAKIEKSKVLKKLSICSITTSSAGRMWMSQAKCKDEESDSRNRLLSYIDLPILTDHLQLGLCNFSVMADAVPGPQSCIQTSCLYTI